MVAADEKETQRFVVLRRNWRRLGKGWLLLLGHSVAAVFGSRDKAEETLARLEAEARAVIRNPFLCGTTLRSLTAYPEPIFRDWLLDAGLEPPAQGVDLAAWEQWWEKGAGRWSDEQKERVWTGLDRLRFYESVERPAHRTAYAVVRVMWEYNDNWDEPGDEGGETVRAFRRWQDAEAYRQLLQEQERGGAPDWAPGTEDDYPRYEVTRWRIGPLEDPAEGRVFVSAAAAPLYEIVEVEDTGGG